MQPNRHLPRDCVVRTCDGRFVVYYVLEAFWVAGGALDAAGGHGTGDDSVGSTCKVC